MNPERANIIFMLLMAAVIAISMKIVGVLLITAMLIIPAATARRFASGPRTDGAAGRGHRVAAVIVVACSDRWNGTRRPARASWWQPWACSCCHSLASLFAQETPDRGAGEERERTPERNPAMNEHVHEAVDLTKNQSLVMGALTNGRKGR
jgi:hypothetical protein